MRNVCYLSPEVLFQNKRRKKTGNKKHWDSAYLHQGRLTSVAIQIRDPDRHQNLSICSLVHCQPTLKISCKSVSNFLCKVANRQTNNDDYVSSSAEVKTSWGWLADPGSPEEQPSKWRWIGTYKMCIVVYICLCCVDTTVWTSETTCNL